MTAKQVRFVTNDEPFDNQNVAELAAFDAAGKPVAITGGSAPTVDTLHGATDTGRAVMKATNAAAARSSAASRRYPTGSCRGSGAAASRSRTGTNACSDHAAWTAPPRS